MAPASCQVSSAITFRKTGGHKKATWLVDEVATGLQLVLSQAMSMFAYDII